MSDGSSFHRLVPETGKGRLPTVARWNVGNVRQLQDEGNVSRNDRVVAVCDAVVQVSVP